MLHYLLHWLGGGSYLDICLPPAMSVCSICRVTFICIDAILIADELSYSFPMTEQSQEDAAHHFLELSTNQVLTRCITCLDGYFQQIQTACRKETCNVKSYFSGPYQDYGINIEAACNHGC